MYCTKCGKALPIEARFCGACGQLVEINSETELTETVDSLFEEATKGESVQERVEKAFRTWNWGAFMFTPLWGIFNKTWVALLALLPLANFVVPFVCAKKGARWAYDNRKWSNDEAYLKSNEKWNEFGKGALALTVVGAIILGVYVMDLVRLEQSNAPVSIESSVQAVVPLQEPIQPKEVAESTEKTEFDHEVWQLSAVDIEGYYDEANNYYYFPGGSWVELSEDLLVELLLIHERTSADIVIELMAGNGNFDSTMRWLMEQVDMAEMNLGLPFESVSYEYLAENTTDLYVAEDDTNYYGIELQAYNGNQFVLVYFIQWKY